MKKLISFTAKMAVLSLLFACSNDDDSGGNSFAGKQINFKAAKIETKVAYNPKDAQTDSYGQFQTDQGKIPIVWSGSENVLISSAQASTVTAGGTAVNQYATYAAASAGGSSVSFTAADGSLYWGAGSTEEYNTNNTIPTTKHNFYSICPASAMTTAGVITTDGTGNSITHDLTSQSDSDDPFLLFGKALNVTPGANVNLKYENLTTVFDINIKNVDATRYLKVKSLSVYVRTKSGSAYTYRQLSGAYNLKVTQTNDGTSGEATGATYVLSPTISSDDMTSTGDNFATNKKWAKVSRTFTTAQSIQPNETYNAKVFMLLTDNITSSDEIVISIFTGIRYYNMVLNLSDENTIEAGKIIPMTITYDGGEYTFTLSFDAIQIASSDLYWNNTEFDVF